MLYRVPITENINWGNYDTTKISAIAQPDRLQAIEKRLLELDVPGCSCFGVKGQGHYANLYTSNGMTQHTCIELFISDDRAKKIAEEIMDAAHTGVAGDGIVTIEKIDALYKIETKS